MASAQRKAWNEAMRSAAGASALPASLQVRTHKRRSDRRKKQDRREKARKGPAAGTDSREAMAATWMDSLEGISPTAPAPEDDDSYDELDDVESKPKRRRSASSSPPSAKKRRKDAGMMPKRFKARSVASILLEEINRDDGSARAWIDAEARQSDPKLRLPVRKTCPVTGMEGIYTEPKSGIPFANLKGLEQLRERPPPWMSAVGSLAFYEAVKSIRDE
eukprot:CAMPEP_0119552434 /NCGR_PEP_ID=MMETSP1352-20130426/5440_1 /TAXON_ID=265584 /ORGANISM="Stauroneis constricta, Strain CCMP1120" /LENGTH=218 /DNA_ID=CAMNT_0007598675 /DNA_START=157 /DNA_END=813 /DNA_ORIENTATION=-